jgi:hypothetical protein
VAEEQLILNRYRPIALAGEGGFAQVQLAWDTRIQRRVAIKCIPLCPQDLEYGNVPGLDEARTAALLSDASIVGVLDFEVQGQNAYLIMEYVEGLTLTQLLRDCGDRLSLDAVAAIFASIARALEIAHDNQVLHLDIKPDNVLINRQGQVKVADFGLARLSDVTGFGAASGGTIGYMPPEQMRQENLDGRCDEWALASVTYEMLVGENPFLAPDLKQAEAAIRNAELVLPSLCREALEAGADDVLFYALDPDREQRYGHISDFAEELARFLGNPEKGQRELAIIVGDAFDDLDAAEDDATRQRRPFERLGPKGRLILARLWSLCNAGLLGFVALANIPPLLPQTTGEGLGLEAGLGAGLVAQLGTGIGTGQGGMLDAGVSSGLAFGLPTGQETTLASLGFEAAGPLFWGLFAMILAAAVLKPHLGSILALFSLVATLFFHEAFLAGILLLVASSVWWFFVGRLGDSQANAALAPVLFGAFGAGDLPIGTAQLSPLVNGFMLNARDAFVNILLAALLSFILAAFGSMDILGWNVLSQGNLTATDVQGNLIGLLKQPYTWCVLGSWIVAGIVVRLFCLKASRLMAFFGILVGSAVLVGGLCLGSWLAAWLAGMPASWTPDLLHLMFTLASGVIMALACLFGVPAREPQP